MKSISQKRRGSVKAFVMKGRRFVAFAGCEEMLV